MQPEIYIEKALCILQKGGVIAFPTDTVYGLGADMASETGVERLYAAKRRSRDKPVPIMIARMEDLSLVAESIPEKAKLLLQKHWPGPLTIVLKKTPAVPEWVTAGGNTVAVRIPDHPLALKILTRFGKPLAVTSANLSGTGDLCAFEDVREAFENVVDLIIPGEVKHRKISTIADFTKAPPEILRGGVIKLELGVKN